MVKVKSEKAEKPPERKAEAPSPAPTNMMRLACVACSRSKVKCDRMRPACARCRRLGLVCVEVTHDRRGVKREKLAPENEALKLLPTVASAWLGERRRRRKSPENRTGVAVARARERSLSLSLSL